MANLIEIYEQAMIETEIDSRSIESATSHQKSQRQTQIQQAQIKEEEKKDTGSSQDGIIHPEEEGRADDAGVNDNQIDPEPKNDPKEEKLVEEKPKEEPKTQPKKEQKKTETKTEYKYYTVKAGDNLSKIAESKGTTVEALKKLNPGIKENSIKVGQKIKYKKIG